MHAGLQGVVLQRRVHRSRRRLISPRHCLPTHSRRRKRTPDTAESQVRARTSPPLPARRLRTVACSPAPALPAPNLGLRKGGGGEAEGGHGVCGRARALGSCRGAGALRAGSRVQRCGLTAPHGVTRLRRSPPTPTMASDAPAAAAAPAVVKSPVDGRWTVDMFTDAFDEPVTCERGGGAKRAVGGEAARATRGTGIRPPAPDLSRPPPPAQASSPTFCRACNTASTPSACRAATASATDSSTTSTAASARAG